MGLKLVMIDLDGTLLTDEKTYDRSRFDRITHALIAQGTIVCIATGNTYPKITEYFDDTIRPELYFACDNGNYVARGEEVLHTFSMSVEDVEALVAKAEGDPKNHIVLNTGVNTYVREASGPAYDHIAKYYNNLVYVESFYQIPADERTIKIAVYSENSMDEVKAMMRDLNENFDGIQAVTSGFGWMDVFSQEGGKGSATRYLQNKYGASPSNSMAFGDSLNDQSMMQEVDYSIIMADGDPELGEDCRYQIGSNEDGAVLDILDQYLETGSLDFLEAYKKEA